jgi:hypothetical protein
MMLSFLLKGLQQLREVWTKNFKSSAAAEDDVQEDDVEMTVEGHWVGRGTGTPKDKDEANNREVCECEG